MRQNMTGHGSNAYETGFDGTREERKGKGKKEKEANGNFLSIRGLDIRSTSTGVAATLRKSRH